MATIRRLSLASSLGLCLLPFGAWAERIENKALRFAFDVPSGFLEAPPPADRVLYSYSQLVEGGRLTLNIERLGRTIGKERVGLLGDSKKFQTLLGQNAKSSTEDFSWGSRTISMVRIAVDMSEKKYLVLQAQVPLTPEAISVTLGGPASTEKQMRDILQKTVASIQGEVSWESGIEIFKKLLVPVLIVSMVLGLWLYQRLSSDT